jgi:hypothetical protein
MRFAPGHNWTTSTIVFFAQAGERLSFASVIKSRAAAAKNEELPMVANDTPAGTQYAVTWRLAS